MEKGLPLPVFSVKLERVDFNKVTGEPKSMSNSNSYTEILNDELVILHGGDDNLAKLKPTCSTSEKIPLHSSERCKEFQIVRVDKISGKRKRPRRERFVPAKVVQESFRRAVCYANKSLATEEKNEATRRKALLGSILKVLSRKSLPITSEVNSFNDGKCVQENVDRREEFKTKIKAEPVEVGILEETVLPEVLYPDQAQPNEILGFLSGSDSFSTNDLMSQFVVKTEAEDPLSLTTPLTEISIQSLSLMTGTVTPMEYTSGMYLEAFDPDDGELLDSPHSRSKEGDSLPTGEPLSLSMSIRRNCLVCHKAFFSGDALASHLYTHIVMNIVPASKEQGFIESNSSSNWDRTFGHMSLPNIEAPNDVDIPEKLLDPLSTNITPKVERETLVHIERRSEEDDGLVNCSKLAGSKAQPTVFKVRYPSFSNHSIRYKNRSVKSIKISGNIRRLVPSQQKISIKIKPPDVKVKPSVGKTNFRVVRDALKCTSDFGTVIQKLVNNGEILKK